MPFLPPPPQQAEAWTWGYPHSFIPKFQGLLKEQGEQDLCVWEGGWESVYLLRVQADSRGMGPAPSSPPLGTFSRVCLAATSENMAKFALNQNLPGECAKWGYMCVHGLILGAHV